MIEKERKSHVFVLRGGVWRNARTTAAHRLDLELRRSKAPFPAAQWVKVEGLSKAALIKSLSPRVLLSNHLLPKGTKMKVNLEDQSRQKVSFSFSQTKKPLQSLFFISSSPEKSGTDAAATSQSGSGKGQYTETKTEHRSASRTRTNVTQPVVSPTKLKTDLSKTHFKKHILNASVTDEQPSPVVVDSQSNVRSTSPQTAEFHNVAPESRITAILQTLAASSGKDGACYSRSEANSRGYKSTTRTHSDCGPTGFESDGESGQSSTRKSSDSKSQSSSNSKRKDDRKYSSSSHSEEKEKSSSKRSDTYERSSSHSKSDRDSRYTSSRSSRSDRRRSRSRSRSRSRGSRTSSSHSKLDKSRGDRGSRSERSHYHESDRRSHRSSPRRERRRSRSRTERTRDSSESEEDRRKARTRTGESSRSSGYSSSHKESTSSSYAKSTSKSVDSSERDKSNHSSKSERSSRHSLDSDSHHKSSSVTDHHKSSLSHKSETNSKISSPSRYAHSHSTEKHQKSDSGREKSYKADKHSRSDEYTKKSHKTNESVSKHSTSSSSHYDRHRTPDRKSNDTFHSPQKTPSVSTVESCSESEERNEQICHKNKKLSSKESNDSKKTELHRETETSLSLDPNKNLNKLDNVIATNKKAFIGESNDRTGNSNQFPTVCESKNEMCNENSDQSGESSDDQLNKLSSVPDEDHNSENKDTEVELSITTSNKSDPKVSQNSNLLFKDSENLSTCKEHDDVLKKSSSASRKSRWDIVGEDSEDNSSKIQSSETKMCVLEDGSQPDHETKEKICVEAGTYFTTKEQVLEYDRARMSDSCKHANISTNPSEPATENDENTIKYRHPLVGHSRDSDCDSEYDSECGEAIKRFHSAAMMKPAGEDTTGQAGAEENPQQIHGHVSYPANSAMCLSQSNMIDSTSHSESTQLYLTAHMPAMENNSLVNSMGQQGYQQYVSSENEIPFSHHKQDSFASANSFTDKNGYYHLWNYAQAEQPSSTCPQPDSSHGTQVIDSRFTGTLSYSQTQSNVPGIDPAAVHIRQDSNEIHPDSLTNDHEVYSEGKTAVESTGPIICQGLSSFVQGNEISSNSRGSSTTEPTKEESFRSLRSRGPPKKRRPELESDSDNEAEAGPTNKKDRRGDTVKDTSVKTDVQLPLLTLRDFQDAGKWKDLAKSKKMPPYFDLIEDNLYLTERKKSKSHRDIKRMQCECPILSREERSKGVMACGEDCLNRLLMIECSSRCLNGAYCSNRRFQMKQHADFEVILTEDKGWGLRAAKDMPANTFVLEYCGEVLDHKEFKARVKEYARMKNIHYYFMSLKNNEIIDATLKGNCSRFMNHSCEPNCETQKWTVNGQLRVGFFTTKAVTEGTELTFDYQFQRYGKEAQKCYCGAPSCRGFLGGENRVSVRAAGGRMKKDRNRKSALTTVDEELEALLDYGEGLYDEKQVVALCRLMVRVETMEQKLLCLKLIQDTQNPSCLKQFLDHHGLSLLWIFMVELSEAKGNSANNIKLQLEILKTLAVLPISTKNMLEESKVLTLIQRWAQTCPHPTENDGYSSENTSRAQTPLNTPDGSNPRVGAEMDNDTAKPSVFRRLKIISENSLDSALSDASKASDGKEDDEDEDEDDDESSRAGLSEAQETKPESETVEPAKAPENFVKEEKEEESNDKSLDVQDDSKPCKDDPEVIVEKAEVKEDISESLTEQSSDQDSPQEKTEKTENELKTQVSAGEPENEIEQDTVKNEEIKSLPTNGDEQPKLEMTEEDQELKCPMSEVVEEPKSQASLGYEEHKNLKSQEEEETKIEMSEGAEESKSQTSKGDEPPSTDLDPTEPDPPIPEPATTESVLEPMEVQAEAETERESQKEAQMEVEAQTDSHSEAQTEAKESDKTNADQPNDSTADVTVNSEVPEVSIPSAAASVEPSVVGTPSQDDEEGLSDVESERSQEPPLSSMDISGMAARLLESWKDLKEVYRIPKRARSKKKTAVGIETQLVLLQEVEKGRENERENERENGSEKRSAIGTENMNAIVKEREKEREIERLAVVKDAGGVLTLLPRLMNGAAGALKKGLTIKLFEQEVAQREAQKQQQLQQQFQSLGYDPALAYASTSGFITYPTGYPVQAFVDPTNPNAGKVLLPTPPVDGAMAYEQTPPLALSSPSSTPQATPVATIPQQISTEPLPPGTSQPYAQPAVAAQDPGWLCCLCLPLLPLQRRVRATPLSQPQPQAAIYYPGQPCPTIYSIPTSYPQGSAPVIQAYTDPAGNYLHSQPVYPGQQGVVVQQGGTVTTIVTSQTQELIVPNNIVDLPPPSPPNPKLLFYLQTGKWLVTQRARSTITTLQTQWDPPTWDGTTDATTMEHESEMDLGTPTYDENPSKFSTKTAEADTSSELAKKSKESFRKEMSQFIVHCLNPYRKPDCKLGRIVNTEDFKHLARKLTHGVMNKELKACKNPEDLECNENVKHKTKEYIKKYMQRFGSVYRPKEDTEVY
ncbi:hypothetical protein WMY93_026020 [Mugilogobius chulae]|uniref:[histone H3]-lysine(36) N-trimethyltransferase n=1 Tax=Mugilogobius chulae TaxID=88201 RepID=A0AAW0MZR6_9GOBI